MARPIKLGLEYFPLDVDIFEDEKVIPVSTEYGFKGEIILVRVLCAIYRNGYFAELSDSLIYKLAKQTGVNHSLVSDVISGLVRWGFFDKSVFDSSGVLTSRGIQKRWKEAVRKRVIDVKNLPYWIEPEKVNKEFPAEETRVSGGRNTTNESFPAEETPQKKRKEKKEELTPIPPKGDESEPNLVWKKKFDVYLADLRAEYKRLISDSEWILQQEKFNPGVDIQKSIEKCCVNFWATEAGWKKKKGSKIKSIDWKSTFANAISMPTNRVYSKNRLLPELETKEPYKPEKW